MSPREFKLVDVNHFGTPTEIPVLDARPIPHDLRHAAVLGVVSKLAVGGQFDLIAMKDPQPMLRELRNQEGEAVSFTYEDTTPGAFRLRFTRIAPASQR